MSEDHFLPNLLVFARLLRTLGFVVSPEQVGDLARVLAKLQVARRENVYYAARALFVHKHSELALFDRAFNLFFAIQGKPPQSVIDPSQAPSARRFRSKNIGQAAEAHKPSDPSGSERPSPVAETVPLYSPAELLRTKRFDRFTEPELLAARRILAAMDFKVGLRKTRRYQRHARGARLDLSRLLRQNLKHGADVYELPARSRRFKPRPLVVLADTSGSMERYSRMVLQLVHALGYSNLAGRVEGFVFGTRLTRITPDLKRRSVDTALARVSARVPDWGGGTRIGDALKTFNYQWARRVLRSGAVVLIISDGWDRGDLQLLRREMERLQKSCSRLIWLNPLLGDPNFSAEAQGLRVALPFVDNHLPVHNLESLEELAALLSSLDETRPFRRQLPRIQIEAQLKPETHFMELPEMGTSDYVRRTMVMRIVNGAPRFEYDENPDL